MSHKGQWGHFAPQLYSWMQAGRDTTIVKLGYVELVSFHTVSAAREREREWKDTALAI